MSEVKTCAYCGKTFIKNGKQIYCGEICQRLAQRPKRNPTLEECIRIAKFNGMSYGQAAKAGLF